MAAQGVVLSRAFSKDSKAQYPNKPMLSDLNGNENTDVGENNELLAAAEFMQYANILKNQGLPETTVKE